jgi:two-component system, NtrC family, sensor kinase
MDKENFSKNCISYFFVSKSKTVSLSKLAVALQKHFKYQLPRIVLDNTKNMNLKERANIFQPFFDTKPTRQVTGLGRLSLAYDIVTKGHGGMIECKSVEGEETTFPIKLPIQHK